MSAPGLRLLFALVLSVLAAGGCAERVSSAPSARATISAESGDSRVSRGRDPFVRPSGAWLQATARGTSSPGRTALREGGGSPPAPRACPRTAASPAGDGVLPRVVRPVFARRLAAARDGTLSSRGTGLPPPLS